MPRRVAVAADQPDWRPVFLAAFRNSGNIRAACQAAGVDRTLVYRVKKSSKAFAAQYQDALNDAVDLLEATAWKRARDPEAPSDVLLIFLLKSLRPDVYREQVRVEVVREVAAHYAEQTGVPAGEIISLATEIAKRAVAGA